MTSSLNDKTIVKDYFNAKGFDRWRRIYGDGDVNKVQADIRVGHQQTINKVVAWLKADQNLNLRSICDAGCGVGSLSIPLMEAGARSIYASDISEKMVGEAQERAAKIFGNTPNLKFETKDLESISGKYNTVICLDVLIHYPTEDAAKMIAHLASLSEDRLILSFAPKTFWLMILKKIGEFFPGPSKTTRAYQHKEQDIRQILIDNGFAIARTEMTSTRFYYSRLLEAVRLR
ncbi:magnesium protoporphyrin IX methyltransferase [Picosynechococcus sp. PCC 7117]|uniref:magnesium protoporphyrin IX methyltransferase n=1 Tax=Picosynechococcus sp. PCC 7117 TaxID=195498 RepID=UPI000810ACF3|nr:magnesium protoporphyrin IX methyltransferase [Picosynechococcus sp. PCC 7117]ANV86815.1 magnesium protoporphyrin IX methyltransferase [Picosynechococcus sp. PCC 7117]